jgi:hypothetical protein
MLLPQQKSPRRWPRTRKAVRRRCEAELLRESDMDDELQLSPIFQARPDPFPPVSPASPTSIDSDSASALSPPPDAMSLLPPLPMPVQSVVVAESPAGPPYPPPAPPLTLPLPAEPPEKEAPPRAPASPPTYPPWTNASLHRPRPYPLSEMLQMELRLSLVYALLYVTLERI